MSIPLTATGPNVRLVVATHPATGSAPTVGVERDGIVYELFVCTSPSSAFTVSDMLDLYLHCGSFKIMLADEDKEQEMICPNSRPMDLESPIGVGATSLWSTALHY